MRGKESIEYRPRRGLSHATAIAIENSKDFIGPRAKRDQITMRAKQAR
jgi:hypothetical protein